MDIVMIVVKILLSLTVFIFIVGFLSAVSLSGKLYAAIILPNSDGSGQTIFLGVFRKKEKAQAMIYQYIQEHGYMLNSEIIECVVNKIPYKETP